MPLPPAMPFTFHVTAVFVEPCTVATNWREALTLTDALVGDTETLTCVWVTAVTVTEAVFELSPSGVCTTTGTVFAVGALPVAVRLVADTNVVGNAAPSKVTTDPATKAAPVMAIVKLPVVNELGLMDAMLGFGMIVTDAVPLALGDGVLVARSVTVLGDGTAVGGMYWPAVLQTRPSSTS